MSGDKEQLELATALAERAPRPAVSGKILSGTAGWTDKTLISSGLFYPRGVATARARLEYYARHFQLVEVDSTYYTLLPPTTVARWVEWTPPDFEFDVKAHPVFTGHPIDVSRLPQDLRQAFRREGHERRVYPARAPPALVSEIARRFVDSLGALIMAGRLRSVLLQFPPWFQSTRGNARALEKLAEDYGQLPLSVEFRHSSLLMPDRRDRVFDLLRAHGLSYVCVDEPPSGTGGVPPIVEVTNPKLSVVRFHGQNRRGWNKRGATVEERFNYLYSQQELSAWLPAVRQLGDQAERVHVVFNNCVRNYAVINAKGLVALLGETR